MIYLLTQNENLIFLTFFGILFSFLFTLLLLKTLKKVLPKDGGREFAHDASVAVGKPQGAGIIFILVFAVAVILFTPFKVENLIYMLLCIGAMITGYLDDSAKTPWGEYVKGFFDFILAVLVAVTFVNFNDTKILIPFTDTTLEIPMLVYIILATILVWVSINVTNCTDGVDGLSGTLAIITLFSIFAFNNILGITGEMSNIILMLVACLLGYLWYNSTPSVLMMGDAGSRAIGLFIAIAVIKTGSPLLYLAVGFMFIVDGALGLLKIALLRFLKIKILVNIRTPIHDHVRKNLGWSNTQTVFRFSIIQVLISFSVIFLMIQTQ